MDVLARDMNEIVNEVSSTIQGGGGGGGDEVEEDAGGATTDAVTSSTDQESENEALKFATFSSVVESVSGTLAAGAATEAAALDRFDREYLRGLSQKGAGG